VLWPREARLTPADVYWGMTLAAAELLRVGVTTTCELYFHEDALIDAVVDAGSRCLAGPAVLQAGPLASTTFEARLDAVADVHRRRHGEAGRIEVSVAPHAPYTVPVDVLRDTAELARSLGALLQIHVAETSAEVDEYRRAQGCSPIAGLAAGGVLGGRVLAAHSIWLDDVDIGIYAEHGVAVAHCPQSNAKLASGVARLTDLLDAGVRVGLGTDGPASNNDLDPWEEMRAAAMFARIARADAGVIPAPIALDLATRSAAAAVDRPDLGSLAPGCKADVVLVDIDDPVFTPLIEPTQIVEHLVWSASGRLVSDVWVAGARVVKAGDCLTVDVAGARRQVTERARALAAG
jgi:5-methylthioadenosine/S-adenosylhomocysteine deaminase